MTIAALALVGFAAFQMSQPNFDSTNPNMSYLALGAVGAALFAAFEIYNLISDGNDLWRSYGVAIDVVEYGLGFFSIIAGAVCAGISGYMGIQESKK